MNKRINDFIKQDACQKMMLTKEIASHLHNIADWAAKGLKKIEDGNGAAAFDEIKQIEKYANHLAAAKNDLEKLEEVNKKVSWLMEGLSEKKEG